MRESGGVVRAFAQPALRSGVGEDMRTLGDTHVVGDRDEGHAGDQTTDDREHSGRRRGSEHGDAAGTANPLSHRRRRPDQIAARQDRPPIRTASPMSAPPATAAGFREASNTQRGYRGASRYGCDRWGATND